MPHTVIVDNAGGHLMQRGQVDICIVGTDRTTRDGDVCNKIGTYLKALAAHDNGVPFYVGLPYPSIDWTIADGHREIPIEERMPTRSRACSAAPRRARSPVDLLPEGSAVANPAFDVTPARLVTALITERGVCAASEAGTPVALSRTIAGGVNVSPAAKPQVWPRRASASRKSWAGAPPS